jgi:hypothetical protein
VSQEIMLSTMYAVAASYPSANASLASLGFRDVGLDDVWQLCGSYGPQNWTYHDASGSPVVDTARFPNMSALPATAHSLGLTAGFYGELARLISGLLCPSQLAPHHSLISTLLSTPTCHLTPSPSS